MVNSQFSINQFETRLKQEAADLMNIVTPELKRTLELAQEKGAGAWLTATPIQSLGFVLNKQQFRDSVCLSYGWRVPHTGRTLWTMLSVVNMVATS